MDKSKISKYLSFVLRHQPGSIGLELTESGWACIDELVDKTHKYQLTKELINEVVETNDKQRFLISDDGERIRANQGHSFDVKLELEPTTPPELLLHGTAERFLNSILKEGLTKQQRHHVHLSENQKTAMSVGARYGKPTLLEINSRQMHLDGFEFLKTANGVWLVKAVPPNYIRCRRD